MKFLTNKKITQKIVIAIVLIMSFNFIMPKKVQAVDTVLETVGDAVGGIILNPLLALLTSITDAAFNAVQDFMLGDDGHIFFMVSRDNTDEYYAPIEGQNVATIPLEAGKYDGAYWGIGDYKIPVIKYSPEAIFANKVPALDANFLKSDMRALPTDEDGKNTMQVFRNIVAGWYVAIRMLAIILLLSVLVYLSIRMMISGVAADKAKYKKMFMDWLVAMCLLFFLHYIMSFAQTISETLVSMISSAGETSINVIVGDGEQVFSTNVIGAVRFQIQHVDTTKRITYFILYVMMIFYTLKFTWIYLKRMISMAFLTLIAPLVALSYPIDKVGDGKSQAFDMWLKEYTYNTLVQPLHCLVYTIFSVATIQVASSNPLLAIVIFPCLGYAEKFLKQMLGFNKASGGTVPGLATSVGAHALGTMVGNIGKAGKGGGKSGSGKVRTNDNGGKRMADKNATKNLEGFEKSAASGPALDFGNNEELATEEEEDTRARNILPDEIMLPEVQQQNQSRHSNEPIDSELEEQQRAWQRNNTEIDSNDSAIMDEMHDVLDNPNATEEDKAMAREQLNYYNGKYGLGEEEPTANDFALMNQFRDTLKDSSATEEDKAMAKEQLDYYNGKYGLGEEEPTANDFALMNQFREDLTNPSASEQEKAFAREQLDYYSNRFGARFIESEPTEVLEQGRTEPLNTKPRKEKMKLKDVPKKIIKGLGDKDSPYLGMPKRVASGLANDAKEGLNEAWQNKGKIARGVGAATGKALYTGAKGAAKATFKAMPAAAIGAMTFAAGSVLTGDLSKGAALAGAAAAGTYGVAGKVGKATLGGLGERIENHMGVSGGIKDTYDRRRYGSEIAARQAKSDKKFKNSREFNEYLKYYYADSEKRDKAREAFMEYRKAGVTDLDEIRKAYKAEENINKDLSKVGGRSISRDEMINTVKLNKKISDRAFTDKKVYNAEKDRIANQLFSGSVKNKDAEARRVLETLKALRNV